MRSRFCPHLQASGLAYCGAWSSSRLGVGIVAITLGCSSGPSAVTPPSINPDGAAAAAMKQYDADGDGFIAGSELDAAVSLKAAMGTLDTDKDGKVSETEIADRIREWQRSELGLLGFRCTVTLDGRPLKEAKVELEPEQFLGTNVLAANGETSPLGMAIVSIPKEKRPDPTWPPGVQFGFYRVRITSGNSGVTIPDRYNTNTILGQQVARDDESVLRKKVEYNLTTK